MNPDLLPPWALVAFAAVLGLVMGSFLNCLAWRLVHGESVLRGRSHCASCGHTLGAADLVPVVSWLALRGRCRYCGERVSARYPLAELLCAAAWASFAWRFGWSAETVRNLVLASVLLAASLVDWEDGWVPDRLVLAGAVGYLAALPLAPAPLAELSRGAVGAAALFVPLLLIVLAADKVLGRESMGGGDLKLFALLGLYLGWARGLFAVMLSCFIGLAFGAVLVRARTGKPFPFVPAMSLAAWVSALWGEPIINWYLALFY